MIKRIATLLGFVGLAGLLYLVAALTSGCGLPITKAGFQQNLAHGIGPMYGHFDAQHRETEELQIEVKKLWVSLGEVAQGQQTLAEWAGKANESLVQLERAGKITQRDLGLARSAIDNLKKQMADVGHNVDTVATEAAAHHQAEQDRFHTTNREVQRVATGVQLGRQDVVAEAQVLQDQAAQDASVAGLAYDDLKRGQTDVGQKVDDLGIKTEEVDRKVENVEKMTRQQVIKLLNDLLKKHP